MELIIATLLFLSSGTHHAPPLSYEILPKITHREVSCLEANVWHESRGEGLLGMMAVAKTTLNRARMEGWPPDVCKVVYQHKQFSWTSKKNQQIKLKNSIDRQSYSLVQLATQLAMSSDYVGYDYMQGADHYHATSVNPSWNKKMEVVMVVGNHKFLKGG